MKTKKKNIGGKKVVAPKKAVALKVVSKKNIASSKEGIKIKKVIKRDGKLANFDQNKITRGIAKALSSTKEGGVDEAKKVTEKVIKLLGRKHKEGYVPEIEEIQDLVERVLMILDFEETAKAYILYREQHRKNREAEQSLDEAVNLVDKYIQEIDWKVKENANMAYSLQGLNNYISSIVSSKYWMNRVYTKEIREAHEGGDFHIHDLQLLAAYCCGWDLQDLLRRGFT
ncbi:MAG: anaerobic ribonucleoside-triphosphate reductase, partial [Candidatus Moraniibacteriota bacterium]